MSNKILVVDDEKLIVKGIKFSLEQDGMDIDVAYDGEEALELIKKNEYEYIGLFFEDIEPAIEVMKYFNKNTKSISELLHTSIDLQEGGD